MVDATGPVGVAAATVGLARLGEDLQFALGEGPCHTATTNRQVVRVPDLARDERWPLYSREATAAGLLAEFCVPLTVGAVGIGVLNVYQDRPGALTTAEWTTLRAHAEAATAVLLLIKQPQTEVGQVDEVGDLTDIRPVVHQATGMLSIQLDTDLGTALLRLRAHAFAAGRPVRDVAAAVVARQLVFTRDPEDPIEEAR